MNPRPDIEAQPSQDAFVESFDRGTPQLVWTRLVADLETPVSAMLKLARDRPMSFLLESVEGGAVRGRYSMIGLEPDILWRAFGNRAEINRNPTGAPGKFTKEKTDTLASLRALLAESKIDVAADLPPMAAGVFGYMGYDTVRLVEHLPDINPDVLGIPDSILVRPTVMVIFDAVKDEMTVATPVYPRPRLSAGTAYQDALARLAKVVAALDEPLPHTAHATMDASDVAEPASNTTPAEFHGMVAARQGVHCRRRHLPGRALSAFLGPLLAATLRALPGAAPHEPVAVPLPSRFRHLRPRRLQPRDSGPRPRWSGHHPPTRRYAPPRRHARGGSGAGERIAGRSQGTRRASDAARPRPQ